jgi:putative ABC transport system permease protein
MFKLILKMAWKNSFLRLSRTILVILMIAVSMSMMLALQGLYDGMAENMLDKNKRSDSGDITLYAKGYRLNPEIKNSISDAKKIKTEIQKMDGVSAVMMRLSADGLASTARKSSFASVIGIDLKEEEKFGAFSTFLDSGELNFSKRGALVGIELAKTLKLRLGSKLVFSTQDAKGEINSIALRVRGIIQTTNIKLDNFAIYIQRDKVSKFLALETTTATQVSIKSADTNLQKGLQTRYPDLEVKSFFQLQPMMQMMQDMMVIFNSITFFIVMLVVFIGILGVMYVSILDRVREFGIMLGIGMAYKYIRLQIILESLIIGCVGFILGSILGVLFLYYLMIYGLDLSAFADAMQSFGYDTILYATIKLSYFTNTFLAIMMASVLSVFLPLRKIKKLNPVEVIKAQI